jgi:O-antigen ligase
MVALVLSQVRGAWLALALAASAWALWLIITARITDNRRARAIWLILAVIGGIACATAIAVSPLGGWMLESSGDRVNIWRNSFSLVRDYPLTGIGLGSYEMAYALCPADPCRLCVSCA